MHCEMKSNGNKQNILYEVKIDMIGFDMWNESVLCKLVMLTKVRHSVY